MTELHSESIVIEDRSHCRELDHPFPKTTTHWVEYVQVKGLTRFRIGVAHDLYRYGGLILARVQI